MKRVIYFILFLPLLLNAQVPLEFPAVPKTDVFETTQTSDTIRISDLVQQQIEKAKEKRSAELQATANIIEEILVTPAIVKEVPKSSTSIKEFVGSMPLHIRIFILISILIMIFVISRRIVVVFQRKSLRILKEKIRLLREEKVRSKENPKLKRFRKELKERRLILNYSEKHITKVARDLNIAKGELLLAARLKLFEVGKI